MSWTPPSDLIEAAELLGVPLLCPEGRGGVWRRVLEEVCDEIEAGERESVLFLCNNATETRAFQRAGRLGFDICLHKGRVKYRDEVGQRAYPVQGQAILYYGPERLRFGDVFGRFGVIAWNGERPPDGWERPPSGRLFG